MAPKVFVSHASEDKSRFVLKFAEKLRQSGIDAWLDRWEMLPGDSLVDKIFEEGLKEATAVIIVISKYSASKPWVREELNTGVVNKINKGTKLIPIVLDDSEVPESLKSTLWENIKDVDSYKDSYDRIVASIFGHREKPQIGSPPAYTQHSVANIGGLTKTDNIVLKVSCEHAITTGDRFLNPGIVFIKDDELLVPEGELKESLEILDKYGYLEIHRTLGGWGPYRITTFGLQEYSKAYIPEYNETIHSVILSIVNESLHDNVSLQEKVQQPMIIVEHILDLLEDNGHIKQSKFLGGGRKIHYIAPTLKRILS